MEEVGGKCQLSKLFTQRLARVEYKSQIFASSALDPWVTAGEIHCISQNHPQNQGEWGTAKKVMDLLI